MEKETEKSLRERLRRAFRIWHHTAPRKGGRALRVFLHVPLDHADVRRLVGTLTAADQKWVFRYEPEFTDSLVPAISAFPDKRMVYEATDLWPFFSVRLPQLEREDVKSVIDRRGLDTEDKLGLLGVLSKRGVTSPYEFELAS